MAAEPDTSNTDSDTSDAPTRDQLNDGLADEGVAYLLCAACEMPVYFDPGKDEDPHGCFCDDSEEIVRWRMLDKKTVSKNAGVFM